MENKAAGEDDARAEKRRIRRRLLGAALVFFAAVVLWQSGDTPPPPEFGAVPDIPAELDISNEARDVPEIITDYVEQVEVTGAEVKPILLDKIEDAETSAAAAAGEEKTAEEKPAQKSESKAEEKPAAQKTETKPAEEKQEQRAKVVVVQIGAFGNHQRAGEIVEELKKKNFRAWAEPVTRNGKELLRVRVGADDDRARAETTKLELVKLGFEANIVNLQ